jgi:hypothetical protein
MHLAKMPVTAARITAFFLILSIVGVLFAHNSGERGGSSAD